MEIKVIQQTCKSCRLKRIYSHERGLARDEVLAKEGWKRSGKSWQWLCPDCVLKAGKS